MITTYTLELATVLQVLDSYSGPDLHVAQWIEQAREQLVALAEQNQDISVFNKDRT